MVPAIRTQFLEDFNQSNYQQFLTWIGNEFNFKTQL